MDVVEGKVCGVKGGEEGRGCMGKDGAENMESGISLRVDGRLCGDVGGRGGAVRGCDWGLR